MSESDQGGAGRREVAYRLFAAEFDDADYSYSESDEERAPNYVITPTGARVNRLFVVGVLTEVEEVSEDVLRARVVDPTGAFVLYAGQYQPDQQAFLDRAEPPTFVAVTGKARTFQPEDSDRVYTSVRPESINTVDAETRDRWTVQTAEQTLQRVEHAATALSLDASGEALAETLRQHGVEEGLAAGIPLALDHYGTTPTYLAALRETALEAIQLVTGEREEVDGLTLSPDAEGDADLAALADASVEPLETSQSDTTSDGAAVSDAAQTEVQTAESNDESVAAASTSAEADSVEPDTESSASEPAAETETGGEETAEPADLTPAQTTDDDSDDSDDSEDSDDIGDFEPGEFDLDEEEREEIEEEYGTEFQSGTEVDDPGEADIETPDPDEGAETEPIREDPSPAEDSVSEGGADPVTDESTTTDETDQASEQSESETAADGTDTVAEADPVSDAEPPADVDIEDAVVEVMAELDEGDGADREAVVETVAERYGVDAAEAEDAIQDALMGGRCYEPDDATLKPI